MANLSKDIYTPLVSVLMPVHNCSVYLRQAIDSILEQTYQNFELVIIDDGSTDDSRGIVESYCDPRIVLIVNGSNIGMVRSLNKGMEVCRGKYIARMDGDDICHPRRLQYQVRFMEKNPETGLCGTWAKTIDEAGKVTGRARNLTRNRELQINLLFSVPFFHPSVMVRATLLKENPYDPDFPQAQDYQLWTRLARITRVANIPRYLLYYRWHGENVSHKNNAPQQELMRRVLSCQIRTLGIDPTEEELDLHRLTFGHGPAGRGSAPEFEELAGWYGGLLTANKKSGIYPRAMFRAYLWSRWAIYCRMWGSTLKAFFPPFMSADPRVLLHLARFVVHFAGKRPVR